MPFFFFCWSDCVCVCVCTHSSVCFYLCVYLQPHHRLSWILKCSSRLTVLDQCSHLFWDVTYCIGCTNMSCYDVRGTKYKDVQNNNMCQYVPRLSYFHLLCFLYTIGGLSQTAMLPSHQCYSYSRLRWTFTHCHGNADKIQTAAFKYNSHVGCMHWDQFCMAHSCQSNWNIKMQLQLFVFQTHQKP